MKFSVSGIPPTRLIKGQSPLTPLHKGARLLSLSRKYIGTGVDVLFQRGFFSTLST
jgi:hypothetical protein